jgi:hypothetical protein
VKLNRDLSQNLEKKKKQWTFKNKTMVKQLLQKTTPNQNRAGGLVCSSSVWVALKLQTSLMINIVKSQSNKISTMLKIYSTLMNGGKPSIKNPPRKIPLEQKK